MSRPNEPVLRISTSVHRKLVENSVAVTSVNQPGIVFGVNDSGNEPLVFAFDSTGKGRGLWKIAGAVNRDWEAASLGPCGAKTQTRSCLYIGDVGDNAVRKSRVTVYRVEEPKVSASIPDSPVVIPSQDRIDVLYPDQPHDVEAMYVGRDGTLFLITKRRLLDRARRQRQALIFSVPASAWDSSGILAASLVDSLPIVPGKTRGSLITDAALSSDGKLLAVRTSAAVYTFAVDTTSGLPIARIAPSACPISGLRERQGEGVGWWWDGRRLLLTSEGRNAPLYVVECPLPKP